MTRKDQFIRKINTLLETSSEEQLVSIDNLLKEFVASPAFREQEEKQSNNFTRNGMQSTVIDIEEGNWGTLYRSKE